MYSFLLHNTLLDGDQNFYLPIIAVPSSYYKQCCSKHPHIYLPDISKSFLRNEQCNFPQTRSLIKNNKTKQPQLTDTATLLFKVAAPIHTRLHCMGITFLHILDLGNVFILTTQWVSSSTSLSL